MALIKCPECGKEISDKAITCPNCGVPIQQNVVENLEEATNNYKGNNENNYNYENTKPIKKEKTAPWIGIISLIIGLIGWVSEPPILSIIIFVAAITLAIISFVRNGKLKVFPILSIIFATLGLLIVAYGLISGRRTLFSSEVREESSIDATTDRNNEAYNEYTIDGITFEIPEKYEKIGDKGFRYTVNSNEACQIQFEIMDDLNLSDNDFEKAFDLFLDEEATKIDSSTEFSNQRAETTTVAGFKTREYLMDATNSGYELIYYEDYINNTSTGSILVMCMFGSESMSDEISTDHDAIIQSATSNKTTKNNTTSDEGVSQDLKEFLDAYEEFVDEYCEFMVEYSNDPTNIQLLTQYTELLTEYADFANKVNGYNQNEMSDEDLKYYVEVTTRCSQKLINAGIDMSK